jgi:hypothetical protein
MKNDYVHRDDATTAIFHTDKKGIKRQFIIDSIDFDKVNLIKGKWIIYENDQGRFKVGGRMNGRYYMIHRFLMDAPSDKVVDHINRNTLDNRRSNLRLTTQRKNSHNRGPSKNNRFGMRNVYYNRRDDNFRVSLCVDGNRMFFGSFKDLKEAEKVAVQARRKYMPTSET